MFCPNCGDSRKKIEWENNILNHFRCSACGHIFHYRPLDHVKVELPGKNNGDEDDITEPKNE